MIKVTENALSALSKAFGTRPDALQFLGGGREDSDGIAYTYDAHGQKMVLKILAIPEDDASSLHRLETRINFANHLGNGGISVTSPIRNAAGNLFETFQDARHIFVAYTMHFAEGKNPSSNELTPEIAYNWGKLTGKAHKLTKTFTVSLSPEQKFGWQDSFTGLCRDADVKNAWVNMRKKLESLPVDADSFGFIHNDNHQQNILLHGNDITLLDFDVAGCGFFMFDITTPLQGLLFDIGGIYRPCEDSSVLERFKTSFLNGYEQENHIDDFWLGEFETFIQYRRILLFTVLQDYLDSNPPLKDAFKTMIANH